MIRRIVKEDINNLAYELSKLLDNESFTNTGSDRIASAIKFALLKMKDKDKAYDIMVNLKKFL